MTLAGLLNQPLTLHRISGITLDSSGNQTRNPAATIQLQGYLEQADTQEVIDTRDTVVVSHRCFLPAGTQVGPLDQVNYAGHLLEVVGEPVRVWNPRTKREHHVECLLRGVTSG